MGIEDRDYYWEDRKRREKKFNKKETYYRPKEFRRAEERKPGKPPNDWQASPDMNKQKWKFLLAFFTGSFITFWGVMIALNINADFLLAPYEVTDKVLRLIGVRE